MTRIAEAFAIFVILAVTKNWAADGARLKLLVTPESNDVLIHLLRFRNPRTDVVDRADSLIQVVIVLCIATLVLRSPAWLQAARAIVLGSPRTIAAHLENLCRITRRRWRRQ